MRAINYF